MIRKTKNSKRTWPLVCVWSETCIKTYRWDRRIDNVYWNKAIVAIRLLICLFIFLLLFYSFVSKTESRERMHSEIFFFLTNIFLRRIARLPVKAKKNVYCQRKRKKKKQRNGTDEREKERIDCVQPC
jgi:membrane protein CcdC involved in cytochrome C biogenesis